MSPSTRKNSVLLAGLIGISVLSGALSGFAAAKLTAQAHPGIVTFDTTRYLNARRASMAALIGKAQAGDTSVNPAATIHQIDEAARPVIDGLAAGRLVVVTQALALSKQVPDITDAVIKKLGLPDVKTTIPVPSVNDMASSYSTSDFYQKAMDWQKKINAEAAARAPKLKQETIQKLNQSVVP